MKSGKRLTCDLVDRASGGSFPPCPTICAATCSAARNPDKVITMAKRKRKREPVPGYQWVPKVLEAILAAPAGEYWRQAELNGMWAVWREIERVGDCACVALKHGEIAQAKRCAALREALHDLYGEKVKQMGRL